VPSLSELYVKPYTASILNLIKKYVQSHEMSTPRVKHIAKIIDIDDLDRNHWRNGYFLLPKL